MRTTITLILVTLSLLIGNVVAAISNSNGWVALMMVLSCFLNAVLMAGIISTCEMRSSWIAYMITTTLFMMLVITRSDGLIGVMQHLAGVVGSWGVLPPQNSSIDFFPVDRLRAAFVISCPPMFGVAAGFVAILCFPGKRFRKPTGNEYKHLSGIHSLL